MNNPVTIKVTFTLDEGQEFSRTWPLPLNELETAIADKLLALKGGQIKITATGEIQ